ncbi:MAG: hypothetical protein MK209_03620, partial [Planctomycetes bacterium]|nr:hypothetical protein [Planctomycetota bacterium]
KLRLVDDQGNSYQTSNPKDSIESGERVALTPTENLFDIRLRRIQSSRGSVTDDGAGFDSQRLRHLPPTLPRRSWMAEVNRSPFLPDGGVAREEDEGVHLILGILEEQS